MASLDWAREELIISLDLYIRRGGLAAGKPNDSEVRLISGLLRRLGNLVHGEVSENYRSPDSIAMRASSWRSMHDEVVSGGKKGLEKNGAHAVSVWRDFSERPELLRKTAQCLRDKFAAYNSREEMALIFEPKEAALPPGVEEAAEGLLLSREHLVRERNRALIASKKEFVLSSGKKLRCDACGLVFSDIYGAHGEGFIEVHHTAPLSTLVGRRITSLSQLALVCANCHRMIHHRRPWLSVEEVQALVTKPHAHYLAI